MKTRMHASTMDRRNFIRLAGVFGAGVSSGICPTQNLSAEPTANLPAFQNAVLRRRVESLQDELDTWITQAKEIFKPKDGNQPINLLNAHVSQLEAVRTLMNAYLDKQKAMLGELKDVNDPSEFKERSIQLIREIIKGNKVWDYFRAKFQLRFVPRLQQPLWIADTVAWDCYRPVLLQAADWGILPPEQFQEPPLCYGVSDFSPGTWERGRAPNDFAGLVTPIPVIEIPWDHLVTVWQYMVLHHEVGHDLETDLKLRGELLTSLDSTLSQAGIPPERIRIWTNWREEVFADLVGIQLGGPAFTESMLDLLFLPKDDVVTYSTSDSHPAHYVRILMNVAYIRTLGTGWPADARKKLNDHADQLESVWTRLYGNQAFFQASLDDFPRTV